MCRSPVASVRKRPNHCHQEEQRNLPTGHRGLWWRQSSCGRGGGFGFPLSLAPRFRTYCAARDYRRGGQKLWLASFHDGAPSLPGWRPERNGDRSAFLAGRSEDPVALLLGLRERGVVPLTERFPWDVAAHPVVHGPPLVSTGPGYRRMGRHIRFLSRRPRSPCRMPLMARFTVHGRTQDECQQALDDLRRLLDAAVTLPPTDRLGGSWIARAEHKTAPDPRVRGFAAR